MSNNSNIQENRIGYIDRMRGIAILLVIFEHCIGILDNHLAKLILSFHMPLFFFISGMVFRPLGGIIRKKAKTILIPQVTLGVIGVLVTWLLDVYYLKRIMEVNVLAEFSAWFLPVLFICEIIMNYVIPKFRNNWYLVVFAIISFMVFCLLDTNKIIYIQQIFAAIVFAILGYFSRPYLDYCNENKSRYAKISGLGILLILFVAILSSMNLPIGMYMNQYGNKPLFFVTAILGILSIAEISLSIGNSKILQYLGRVSIILYVYQFTIIRFVKAIINRLFSTSNDVYPFYIIIFIVTMLFLVPLVMFSDKYLYWAFGRKKK